MEDLNMFNSNGHMTVGDWFVFHLLMAIPLVNIVVYIVLLFSSTTNPSLESYLILPLIILVIVLGIIVGMIAIGMSLPEIGAYIYV
jgi:hypothetical protein